MLWTVWDNCGILYYHEVANWRARNSSWRNQWMYIQLWNCNHHRISTCWVSQSGILWGLQFRPSMLKSANRQCGFLGIHSCSFVICNNHFRFRTRCQFNSRSIRRFHLYDRIQKNSLCRWMGILYRSFHIRHFSRGCHVGKRECFRGQHRLIYRRVSAGWDRYRLGMWAGHDFANSRILLNLWGRSRWTRYSWNSCRYVFSSYLLLIQNHPSFVLLYPRVW